MKRSKKLMIFTSILIAAIWNMDAIVSSSFASPASAKAELHSRLEGKIADFCKNVHNSVPSIPVSTIVTTAGGAGDYPNLLFKYKYIGCKGVDKPALKQGGFCGLTMNGMVCAVKTFSYRDGNYVEISQDLEGIFE